MKKLYRKLTAVWLVFAIIFSIAINYNPLRVFAIADANGFDVVDGILLSYNGTDTIVNIPSGVTKIADYAFIDNDKINTVNISPSVTEIGDLVFLNCINLTTISGTNTVVKIGNMVFQNTKVSHVVYSRNGLTINYVPKNLTTFDIPSNVDTIGAYAFYGCKLMTSVSIPESVEFIEAAAFYDCSILDNVELHSSISEIGESAFFRCEKLSSIIIPESVKKIGTSAFSSCKALTIVTLPKYLKSIGSYAFFNCISLETITVPICVSILDEMVFGGCIKLSSIYIPPAVVTIDLTAFDGSSALSTIYCEYGSSAHTYAVQHSLDFVLTVFEVPPTPVPTPTPAVTATPSMSPTPAVTATPSMSPTPNVSSSPTPSPAVTATPSMSPTPNPSSSPTPSPAVTATPSMSPTPNPSSSPTPGPVVTATPTMSPTPSPVRVKGVALNKTTATLRIPATLQLVATIYPTNATNKLLTWSSSNIKIAKVSSTGKVSALAPGLAQITVTTRDGAIKATCVVKVVQPVTSVKFTKTGKASGATLAAAVLGRGKVLALAGFVVVGPANASDKRVSWKSSAAQVAAVSSKGVVKGIKKGTAFITVTTVDGKKTAKCKITVG